MQRILDADVVGSLHWAGRHDLGDGHPGERLADQPAGLFRTGGAQQEPAQEDRPDSADQAAGVYESGQTVRNQQVSEQHANAGGDTGRSQPIARAQPDERLQQPAPIQRKGGDEIEDT